MTDPYDAIDGVDVLVVMTEWDMFRWLDFDQVKERMAGSCVIDGRNLLDRHQLLRRGFTYRGIGRYDGSCRGDRWCRVPGVASV